MSKTPATKPAPPRSRLVRILTSPPVRWLGAALAISCWACFLVWFLQCAYVDYTPASGWEFIDARTRQFCYSVLLVAIWLTGLTALLRSAFQAGALTWAVFIVIAFINSCKLAARGTPLLPEDFGLIGETGSLTQFVEMSDVVRVISAALLLVVIACYGGSKIRRFYRRAREADLAAKLTTKKTSTLESVRKAVQDRSRAYRILNAIFRFGVVGVAVYALMLTTAPIRLYDEGRYYYVDWLNATFEAYNPTATYNRNGFILGYLYNLEKYQLTAPDDYSEETIADTIAEYAAIKAEDDATSARTDLADADYDIYIILNESFYDFSVASDYFQFVERATGNAADLTPNLHAIMENSYYGYMYSLDYSGATATIEFEVATGLTNYWINTVPFTSLIPSLDALPSVASWARDNGLATTGIHGYNGDMYKRNFVYPILGIDNFLHTVNTDTFTARSSSGYVDDGSLYEHALNIAADADQRQFFWLVTMQNHMPFTYYPVDSEALRFQLANPESIDYNATLQNQMENYVQIIYESDAYLGEFIATLEASDRPSVVLFYGDHASLLPDAFVSSGNAAAYQTPFFIWANFDIGAEGGVNLGTYSANCLTDLFYDALNVKKPVYSYLTAAVCSEVSVLTHTSGQDDAIEALYETSAALRAYQMATYDLLGGEQYWLQLGGFED